MNGLYTKYFLGISIPSPVLEEIESIKQHLFEAYKLKGALRCDAHITLHRPFLWKTEKENELKKKLSEFHFTQFEIRLHNFSFFEPRVIFVDVAPNQKLNHLHVSLKEFAKRELRLYNEWEDERGFYPHVTVASRDLKKDTFHTLQNIFIEKKFDAQFSTSGISLMKLEKRWEKIN